MYATGKETILPNGNRTSILPVKRTFRWENVSCIGAMRCSNLPMTMNIYGDIDQHISAFHQCEKCLRKLFFSSRCYVFWISSILRRFLLLFIYFSVRITYDSIIKFHFHILFRIWQKSLWRIVEYCFHPKPLRLSKTFNLQSSVRWHRRLSIIQWNVLFVIFVWECVAQKKQTKCPFIALNANVYYIIWCRVINPKVKNLYGLFQVSAVVNFPINIRKVFWFGLTFFYHNDVNTANKSK